MNSKLLSLVAAVVSLLGVVALVAPIVGQILTGTVAGIVLGLSLAVIGAVAAILIVNQIRFGMSADFVLRKLVAEGDDRGYPDLPRRPSGRVLPEAAMMYVEKCRAEVDTDPTDWRLWFLLAGSFEIAHDRRNSVRALARAKALLASG
ncbi:hypothetical protein ACFWAY_47290 [Rhodococcus sp. NPDC059968]|uniref:hypothetical protein n=1 Tax=Rhodococcus sp. NPDC059968 TaxID=3347017 RepID=UPI003670BA2E